MTTKKNNRTLKTCSFGVLTPSGMRRIDLPDDGQDLWISIESYDKAHGTQIYDLYGADDVFINADCSSFPVYDPSDEYYSLTGSDIEDILYPSIGPGKWIFKDCVVHDKSNVLAVYMQSENGGIGCQYVFIDHPEDRKRCIDALNRGETPTDGWEDGRGNTVAPYNCDFVAKNPVDVRNHVRLTSIVSRNDARSRNLKSMKSANKKPSKKTGRNTRHKRTFGSIFNKTHLRRL